MSAEEIPVKCNARIVADPRTELNPKNKNRYVYHWIISIVPSGGCKYVLSYVHISDFV